MHATTTKAKQPARSDPLTRAREGLRVLRESPTALQPVGSLQCVIDEVSEALEVVAVEHAGMAEELLCVYEQLGAVFDITRKLSHVRQESDVVDLFVDNLQRTFSKRDVFVVEPRCVNGTQSHSQNATSQEWLSSLIRRAHDQKSVMVETAPNHAAPDWAAEAMVGPVFAGNNFVCAIVLTRASSVAPFCSSDMMLLESLTMFCGDLMGNHRLVLELQEMSISVVRSLVSAVDQKDEYTSGHSLRVGYFAMLLGKELGLGDADMQMLQWSALLHDVGKIGIRDDVLKKTGKLTDEEFDHMKEHPVRSHKLVRQVPQFALALDGVLHHHEHYDGNGYPSGLKGEDIPLQARIIQIADVFDALTSDRSYRSKYDWVQALDILEKESGKTVDPNLQEIFARLVRDTLRGDPQGWEKMVERADHFARGAEALSF